MASFKYKFDTIKNVKQILEKKTQKELAIIDLDISKKRDEIFKLSQKLKDHKKKKSESKVNKSNQLHFFEKYESYLEEQIKLIQKYISKRMVERNKKLEELVIKSKETKTFEKLEERHFTEFIKEQDKIEQKDLDEFAVNEYLKE